MVIGKEKGEKKGGRAKKSKGKRGKERIGVEKKRRGEKEERRKGVKGNRESGNKTIVNIYQLKGATDRKYLFTIYSFF